MLVSIPRSSPDPVTQTCRGTSEWFCTELEYNGRFVLFQSVAVQLRHDIKINVVFFCIGASDSQDSSSTEIEKIYTTIVLFRAVVQ